MMHPNRWMPVAGFVLLAACQSLSWAGEAQRLGEIRVRLEAAQSQATELRQQLSFRNAAAEIEKARQAAEAGDDKAAIGHKKKALQWVTWAARECADVSELAGSIGESLVAEGGMAQKTVDRVGDLLKMLDVLKKHQRNSPAPFEIGMAIGEVVQGILDLIDDGLDGFHPRNAMNWTLNAAAACDQVQALIDQLTAYQRANRDETGIPAMTPETAAKLQKMLDELYRMKREGASGEQIVEMTARIKRFLDEESGKIARERARKLEESSAGGGSKPPGAGAAGSTPPPGAPPPVTSVTFSALDGPTEVHRPFVGHLEQVRFVAADGSELERKDVAPRLQQHDDSWVVEVGDARRVAGIVLMGSAGIVQLMRSGDGTPAASAPGLAPLDGVIDIRNGALNETLRVTGREGAVQIKTPIGSTAASLDGRPLKVVATRPGEIAVVGSSVPTLGGLGRITVSASGQTLATANVPAWGYELTMPAVTKTGVWVPISLMVFGLGPADAVQLRFKPLPGQQIEPLEVRVPAGQALLAMPVARLLTNQPGPQTLQAIVTREAP